MKVVSLCYHKVGTEAEEGRRLNIHPQRLDSHIRFFKRRGFNFVKAGELASWPTQSTVCFTFDDGYTSTVENGEPVFNRHGVPMTIYVISDSVDEMSSWDGELASPLASWDTLRQVQSRGHEIGNHTATHPHLNQLTVSEQLEEISRCDVAMKANGLESSSFCYPYGHLKKLGHKVGMAIGKRPALESDDRLRFPRIVIAYGDALPLLLYKLHLRPHLKK
jgi:peptidoglycan/xylan/chitin deacetylase (PgdA/CDA1 family)